MAEPARDGSSSPARVWRQLAAGVAVAVLAGGLGYWLGAHEQTRISHLTASLASDQGGPPRPPAWPEPWRYAAIAALVAGAAWIVGAHVRDRVSAVLAGTSLALCGGALAFRAADEIGTRLRDPYADEHDIFSTGFLYAGGGPATPSRVGTSTSRCCPGTARRARRRRRKWPSRSRR